MQHTTEFFSSVATDQVPPLFVLLHSSSSLGSGGNDDGKEEMLVGSVDQVTTLTTKRFRKENNRVNKPMC